MDKLNLLRKNDVKIKPINVNELRITFPNKNYTYDKFESSKRYLKTLSYDDIDINLGESFDITIGSKSISYKANKIVINHSKPNTFTIQNSVYNKATNFILPFLFNKRSMSSYIIYENGSYSGFLINTYLDCSFIDKKDNYSVFVLLKFIDTDEFKIQEDIYERNYDFIKKIDINKNYVLYEFSIPKKFRNDFDKLIEGEYSKIGKIAKNRLANFHKNSIEGSFVNLVVNRDPNLVSQYEKELDVSMDKIELCSKFNEDEILTKEMI